MCIPGHAIKQGWLGARTTVLHGGEGPIGCVRWSGSLIAWSNPLGVQVQRVETLLMSQTLWRTLLQAMEPLLMQCLHQHTFADAVAHQHTFADAVCLHQYTHQHYTLSHRCMTQPPTDAFATSPPLEAQAPPRPPPQRRSIGTPTACTSAGKAASRSCKHSTQRRHRLRPRGWAPQPPSSRPRSSSVRCRCWGRFPSVQTWHTWRPALTMRR